MLIRKTRLTFLLLGALLFALVFSTAALALNKYDFGDWVSTETGFRSNSVYKFCNPLGNNVSVPAGSRVSFTFVNVSKGAQNVAVDYLKNETRTETWVNDTCTAWTKNNTLLPNGTQLDMNFCSAVSGKNISVNIATSRWLPLSGFDWAHIAANTCYAVRVSGDTPNGTKTDNILSFNGYTWPEKDWWNVSWSYRAPMYISATGRDGISLSYANTTGDYPAIAFFNISSTKINSTCQDVRVTGPDGTSPLAYALENNTCTTQNGFTWGWIRFNVTNLNATTNYTAYLYYGNPTVSSAETTPFDSRWVFAYDGYGMRDYSPNANNLTTVTGITWDTGKYGNGIRFYGNTSTGTSVSTGDAASLDVTSVSLITWASSKSGAVGTQPALIHRDKSTHSDPYYVFYLNAPYLSSNVASMAAVTCANWDCAGHANLNSGPIAQSQYLNQWHLYAGTYTSGDLRNYFDGVLNTSSTLLTGSINAEATGLVLGNYRNLNNAMYNYNGTMDETWVMNIAVTPGFIATVAGQNWLVGVEENSGETVAPQYALNAPSDGAYIPGSPTFNITAWDNVNLVNWTLVGDWTGNWGPNATNTTPQNNTPSWLTVSNIAEGGPYTWSINATDNSSNTNNSFTYNRTFFIDRTAPVVTLGNSLADLNVSLYATNLFDLKGSDNMVLSWLAIYGNWSGSSWGSRSTNSTVYNNSWWNASLSIPAGHYIWGAFANDSAGNSIFSANRTFDIVDFFISFFKAVPADISTTNLLGADLVSSYNITSTFPLTASNITKFFRTNTTAGEGCYFQNGTYIGTGWQTNGAPVNSSPNGYFNWSTEHDTIYCGSFNLVDSWLSTANRNANRTLNSAGATAAQGLYDTKNDTRFNYVLFMAMNNTATSNDISLHYCNSTYTTGAVNTSANCFRFATVSRLNPINNTEGKSQRRIFAFPLNYSTGMVGTVKATNFSQFVFLRQTGSNWDIVGVSNITRNGLAWFSSNGGATHTNFSGTFDIHLHQFNGTEIYAAYVCASVSAGTNCTAIRSDLLDLGGIPPSSPMVYSPAEGSYRQNISINYTAAVSPNEYAISYYNITLNYLNETLAYIINGNNSNNLSMSWNTTLAPDGQYEIHVNATDNNTLSSEGHSDNITIDNTPPAFSLTWPTDGMAHNGTESFGANTGVVFRWTSTDALSSVACGDVWFDFPSWRKLKDYSGFGSETNCTPDGNSFSQTLIITGNVLKQFKWSVSTNDSLGNLNTSFTQNFTFWVDTIPPISYLQGPANNQLQSNGTVNISVKGTDGLALSTLQLYGNWSGWGIKASNTTPYNDSSWFSSFALPDGSYSYTLFVNDTAGNSAYNATNRTFTIDTLAPKTSPANLSIALTSTNVLFPCYAEDALSPLANVSVWTDVLGSWSRNSTNTSVSAFNGTNVTLNITDLVAGPFTFGCEACDTAGNCNRTFSSNSSVTVTLDSTAPTLDIQSPLQNGVYGLLNLTVNASDNGTGVSAINFTGNFTATPGYLFRYPGYCFKANVTGNDTCGMFQNGVITPMLAPDATWFNATDGNWSTYSTAALGTDAFSQKYILADNINTSSFIVTVRTSLGDTNVSLPDACVYYGFTHQKSLRIYADWDSGIPQTRVACIRSDPPGNSLNVYGFVASGTVYELGLYYNYYNLSLPAGYTANITDVVSVSSPLADNGYNLTVFANDTFGNSNTSSVAYFVADSTAPALTFNYSLPNVGFYGFANDSWAMVAVNFTESHPDTCIFALSTTVNYTMTRSGNRCFLNVTPLATGDYGDTLGFIPKPRVYMNDTVGNWGVVVRTWPIREDTVAPNFTITPPDTHNYFYPASPYASVTFLMDDDRRFDANYDPHAGYGETVYVFGDFGNSSNWGLVDTILPIGLPASVTDNILATHLMTGNWTWGFQFVDAAGNNNVSKNFTAFYEAQPLGGGGGGAAPPTPEPIGRAAENNPGGAIIPHYNDALGGGTINRSFTYDVFPTAIFAYLDESRNFQLQYWTNLQITNKEADQELILDYKFSCDGVKSDICLTKENCQLVVNQTAPALTSVPFTLSCNIPTSYFNKTLGGFLVFVPKYYTPELNTRIVAFGFAPQPEAIVDLSVFTKAKEAFVKFVEAAIAWVKAALHWT